MTMQYSNGDDNLSLRGTLQVTMWFAITMLYGDDNGDMVMTMGMVMAMEYGDGNVVC